MSETAFVAEKENVMEQWQIDALQKVLETQTKEVEAGQRVYTSSQTYGSSRYHLVEKRYDGVQIEQVDSEEKWNKRVNLYTDEIPVFLKTLLTWYLDDTQQRQQQQDDGLGDLDDQLF